MVKVFLCETAKDCFSRLQALVREIEDVCVLFPSAHFYDQFTCFYPRIDPHLLFTPSKLLYGLNEESYTEEIACLFNEYDGSIDPNLFLLDAEIRENLSNFKGIGFFSENFLKADHRFPYKNCILYGPFPKNLQTALIGKLKKIFSSIFIIKRGFNKDLLPLPETLKSYHVETITEEKLWIEKRLQQNTKIPFTAYCTNEFIPLFEEKYDAVTLNWLAWQELGNLGSFLIYLRIIVQDDALFKAYKKDLDEAYAQCLVEGFNALKSYLLEHDKLWIKDFTLWEFPQEANVSQYIQIFQQTEFVSIFSKKNYAYLANCLFPYTKNQFFAYLRKTFKIYRKIPRVNLLQWEEAIYFPIKNCYFVHALSEGGDDKKQLSWLSEIANEGGIVEVCSPLMDEKGMPQKTLLEANVNEGYLYAFSHEKSIPSKVLALPKERIKFSCKAWERFYLCPRRTWLDVILKADPMAIDNHCLKAKIFGEWVHDNLQFSLSPKSLQAWQANITKNATGRWEKLTKQLNHKLPYVFNQWHLRALELSHKMAYACEDLFKEGWQLFSEYALPKNIEYNGRIDLLAIKGKQAIIIDYKTAAHYLFTKQQIRRGHGLQLLLYGRSLHKFYENITLRVIDKNGNNLTLNLSDISESVKDLELWIKNLTVTGLYEPLPEERENTLPLCWQKNM